MSLKFACPGCQKTMKVDERLAGKVAKCPACGVKLKIPTPKPVAAGTGATGSRGNSNKAASSASAPEDSGGLPFDESEWDEALNPFESPKAEEKKEKLHGYNEPKKVSRKQLKWTRLGLKMVNYGLNGAAFCIILMYANSYYQVFIGEPEAVGILPVLFGLFAFFGLLLFVGPYLCVTVPEKTGAQSVAIVTAISQTSEVFLCALFFTGAATDPAAVIMLLVLILVAGVTSYFSFLKFMVKLANYLGQKDIAESVSLVITLGVVNVVSYVLLFVSPIVAIKFPDYRWLFGYFAVGLGLTLLVCGLWAIASYASAVNKLSKAV